MIETRRRKADSLRSLSHKSGNSRPVTRGSKLKVSTTQSLSRKSSAKPQVAKSADRGSDKKRKTHTKTADRASSVQPIKTTKILAISVSPVLLTENSQTLYHRNITFVLKKVAGKEDCFKVNDKSSQGFSEMSTKSADSLIRHRKNVARNQRQNQQALKLNSKVSKNVHPQHHQVLHYLSSGPTQRTFLEKT
ncbi:uncharacterized protein [Ptychodera flava]|uniref:uncharacterized protein isoform X2 n=1 Tax=Ptychodera flava TaxID=63121 RepID=UPI003969E799